MMFWSLRHCPCLSPVSGIFLVCLSICLRLPFGVVFRCIYHSPSRLFSVFCMPVSVSVVLSVTLPPSLWDVSHQSVLSVSKLFSANPRVRLSMSIYHLAGLVVRRSPRVREIRGSLPGRATRDIEHLPPSLWDVTPQTVLSVSQLFSASP